MKRLRSHLAGKLLVVFITLVMISAGTVASVSYYTTRQALQREVSLRLSSMAEQKANQIEAWCQATRRNLAVVASLPEVDALFLKLSEEARRSGFHSPAYQQLHQQSRQQLRVFTSKFGYRDLILASPEERVLVSVLDTVPAGSDLRGGSLASGQLAKVVQRARMFMETELSEFTSPQSDQEPTAFIAAPAFGQARLLGVLAAQIDNREMSDIVNDLTGLGETGEVMVGATKTSIRENRVRLITPTRFDLEAASVGWLPVQRSTMRGMGFALVNPGGMLEAARDHRNQYVLAASRYAPSLAGTVVAKIDMDEAYLPVENQRRNFLLVLGLAFLFSTVIGLAIARSITGPLVRLTRAVGAMARGDLHQTVDVRGEDELGRLAEGFNAMAGELLTSYTQIERKVEERTVELKRQSQLVEMLRRVATEANQASGIEQVLKTGLDAVADYAGWPLGHAYLWDGGNQRLTPTNIWHCLEPDRFRSFMEVTRSMTFEAGVGLPGRVLSSARPSVIADVTADPNFPRNQAEVEVRGGFAFPVWAGSQIVAVLEFFSLEAGTPGQEMLDTMAEIGMLLGRVFEREQAQADLRAARDAAERANEAKTTFLATMSHEVRTPMNAVIGMTGLLLETALDHQQRDLARTVLSSGENLLAILNEILDFSKIEAGRLELEAVPFDVTSLVEGALDLMAGPAAAKGLDLAYSITPGTARVMVGDATRLRQILVNLISNAIKFTEQGEVVVSLSGRTAGPDEGNGGGLHEIAFSVRDTGIGIPAQRMDRLFQPFSQVDASTSRRYGGTGLGLVISKRYAEAMGGTMWVESEVGRGTTMHFTILGQARAAPVPAYEEANQPTLRSKRVLIVDDNETNRRLARLRFESWGMVCHDAATGQEALQALQAGERFDVAILDIQMPEMDGVSLARAIRRLPGGGELSLIAWSSLGRKEIDDEVNFAAYLHKPLRPSQLYNVLIELFGGQEVHVRPIQPESQYDSTLAQRHPLRILVADDVAVNLKMMNLMLSRFGYRCDNAGNGLEVLQAVSRQTYDVILMDVNMPEMDGVEATREIHKSLPPRQRPRIVALTANVLTDDQTLFREAGMEDFLSKPVSVDELRATLLRCPSPGPTTPPPSNGVSEPAIDPKALESLRQMCAQGSPDALKELLSLVREEFPNLLSALRQARDAHSLSQAAHALKGGSSNIGALKLSKLAQALERKGRDGVASATEAEVSAIQEQIDLVMRELQAVI